MAAEGLTADVHYPTAYPLRIRRPEQWKALTRASAKVTPATGRMTHRSSATTTLPRATQKTAADRKAKLPHGRAGGATPDVPEATASAVGSWSAHSVLDTARLGHRPGRCRVLLLTPWEEQQDPSANRFFEELERRSYHMAVI